MRAHSVRIWRTVALVAVIVTRPSRIESCTCADAVEAARTSRRAPPAIILAVRMGPCQYTRPGLFVPKILDYLLKDVVQGIPGPIPDKALDFGEIGHAPRHVLEAGFVRFVIRNEFDRRARPRELAHPIGERADGDLLRIADVDYLSDRLRLDHELQHRAHDIGDVAERACLETVPENGDRFPRKRLTDEVGNDHPIRPRLPRPDGVEETHDDDGQPALFPVPEREELVDRLAARVGPAMLRSRTHHEI